MRRAMRVVVTLFVVLGGCTGPEGPRALYTQDPSSLDNPFPDARLMRFGKGLDASVRPRFYEPFLPKVLLTRDVAKFFDGYSVGFAELRGFGNLAATLVRFSEELEAASLEDDAGPRFVFLEQAEAGTWSKGPRAVVEVPPDPILKGERKFFALVRPELPLRAGGKALLGLFSGVKTKAGAALVRGRDYHELAESHGALEVSAIASAFGKKSADVVFHMPLWPQDVTGELVSLRDWARRDALVRVEISEKRADKAPLGQFRAPDDNLESIFAAWIKKAPAKGLASVGAIVAGRYGSRDFRGEDGVFSPAHLEKPDGAPEVMLDFVLTLPKGPRPAGGFPVVIGGHGLGGRNSLGEKSDDSFCLSLAQLFAEKGLGCIGIDAASHGNRGNIAGFFSVADLRRARDNFRQTAADMLQLDRLVRVMDLDRDGKPDLNPTPLYFGNSLGGIMGATFVALNDRVSHAVLNVPGGGLTTILLSDAIRDEVGIIIAAETGMSYQTEGYYASFPLFRALGQLLIEPGDPIHYAALLKGRRVLIQEGKGDRTIPNAATRALARTAGIEEITASVTRSEGVSGLFSIDPIAYGVTDSRFDPHSVFWKIDQARRQAVEFFTSGGTEIKVFPP